MMKLFKVKYKDGSTVLILADRIRQDSFMDITRFIQNGKEIFAEFNHWIQRILMTELD